MTAGATRAAILEAALELFGERGYEGTTMREIAARAGTALGHTYYYFPSKDHLVRAFYERIHEEFLVAVEPTLERERSLGARLRGVLTTSLEVIDPHHDVAASLFGSVADPRSPINPLGPGGATLREQVVAVFARTVDGARPRVPDDVREQLPVLLWALHNTIVLYWLHDRSPQRRRSRLLVDTSVRLVTRMVSLMKLPGMRTVRHDLQEIVGEIFVPLISGENGGEPAAEPAAAAPLRG